MSFGDEIKPYSEVAQSIKPGAIYEHYKGLRFKILHIARHCDTYEELVVYQALYGDGEIWIRPVKAFPENVTIDGKVQLRFRQISREFALA